MKIAIEHYSLMYDNALFVDGQLVFSGDAGMEFPELASAMYKSFGLGYPKFYKMDNLSKLGFLATEILIKQIPDFEIYNKEKIGVFLINKYSSLDTDQRYYESVSDIPSPSLFVYTLPNIVIGEICIRHKITGEHGFFLAENFDGDFLCSYIHHMFATSLVEAALAGWVDYYDGYCFLKLMWLTPAGENEVKPLFTPENVQALGQPKS